MVFCLENKMVRTFMGANLVLLFSWLSLSQINLFLFPKPFYVVGSSWLFGGVVILVPPLLYLSFGLLCKFFSYKKYLFFVFTIAALNHLYLAAFFKIGLVHQGALHIIGITILNIFYFLTIVFFKKLEFFNISDNKKKEVLNLYLFIGLAWCFFPSVGEMP